VPRGILNAQRAFFRVENILRQIGWSRHQEGFAPVLFLIPSGGIDFAEIEWMVGVQEQRVHDLAHGRTVAAICPQSGGGLTFQILVRLEQISFHWYGYN
jgi:hypothetical protein